MIFLNSKRMDLLHELNQMEGLQNAVRQAILQYAHDGLVKREDYVFQKAKDTLVEIKALAVSDVSSVYQGYLESEKKYNEYVSGLPQQSGLRSVGDTIGKFIAYCDSHAAGGREWNPERIWLANSSIQQPNWIKNILRFIEQQGDTTSLLPGVANLIRYLDDPINQIPISNDKHRQILSEHILKRGYNPQTFVADIKQLFIDQGLETKNPKNVTYLINRLLYGDLKAYWRDIARIWRLGTRDNNIKDGWPEMLSNEIASIGWNDLGDLRAVSPSKEIIKAMLTAKGYNYASRMATRKAGEIWDFISTADTDDYIVAVDGQQIKGIGRITGDYAFDADMPTFWHTRPVAWLVTDGPFPVLTDGIQTTFYEITNSETRLALRQIVQEIPIAMSQIQLTHPLNTILYGPPGTGKTYRTVDHALSIVDGHKTVEAIAEERKNDPNGVKQKFDDLLKKGRIAFCTFHQSMGYEDFIEGIKPLPPDDSKQMQYDVVDGIFKILAKKADSQMGNFLEVIEQLKQDISEANGKTPITIKAPGSTFDVIYKFGAMFYVRPHNSIKTDAWYAVSIENLEKYHETTTTDGIYNLTYVRGIHQYLVNERGLLKGNGKEKVPYVLIIDEINRGNISQIFGELITLLEQDKRQGASNALSVTLPYSGKPFSVPPNLYVIGTMNTADRSVEALDTALRRRFSFVRMESKPSELPNKTIGNINLVHLLDAINERLMILIDADHTIGHAWLWEVTDLEGLKLVFKDKILPLLQEFFYNDYEKIGLVLGEAFVSPEKVKAGIFAKFTGGSGLSSEYTDRYLFKLNPVEALTEADFISIYPTNESNQ